ncbi:glutamine synthetase family protein [Streptomyces griseocarneus]|uniref:glutamine synthetase family protein n=1 Tax=Streptomyces griseocarneus TaxID=51201 RepID=UPI00167CD91C|nr:glutamine synthetase family protein [Streptomyces griseocarneus]MBZ6475970.1 glutamine synthetase family protein [Streptomyces griseocarneus]GHG49771.1 glutamine synthetase [Streptomyces griseocarneus]
MQERERAESAARQAAAQLTAQDVRGVALTWVDNAGISRVKAVPTSRLAHAARRGVGASPCFDVYLVDDSAVTSRHIGGPDGDLRLFPDLDRLTVLAAQPGWAWAPVDRYEQHGVPYAACQRQFARRMADAATARGLRLRMGFETEWVVMHANGHEPPRYGCSGPAYGMTRVVELSDYLRDVLDALTAQQVEVLQIHPEYSPGQFEVSVAPSDPVGAADLSVLVRETVRAVSRRHDLDVSFAPVVEPGGVGNGAHLHLSLWRDERNLCRGGDGPYGMTDECESFLAGVLRELPALLALGAPTPASYLRLEPSRWAGVYRCWGLEAREAALRFVTGAPDDTGAANAEVKCFDAAANPYLVTGAVIAAGLAGLDDGLRLPPPAAGDPAVTGGQERLPTSLAEALEHFERSELLRRALGDPLFEAIAAVRAGEVKLFEGLAPKDVAAATRRRY